MNRYAKPLAIVVVAVGSIVAALGAHASAIAVIAAQRLDHIWPP